MTKVTYLFGAGASAGTDKRQGLPIVNQLQGRIKDLIRIMNTEDNKLWLSENEFFNDLSNKSKRYYQMELIEDWKWLSDEASKCASIDTLAKKLFLKGAWANERNIDLNRLKIALSMFFVFEQTRLSADIRYDTFFASILNANHVGLPENIRVISWNYDYQFEKVYSDYIDNHNLKEIRVALNVVSKYLQDSPKKGFSLIKLNGTTTFSNADSSKYIEPIPNITLQLDIKTVDDLTYDYARAIENKEFYSNLSFAWEGEGERSEDDNPIIKKAITSTQDTEILVVIGYSFPFFNREVDRKIIGAMKNLRKVYFQSPDAENIKTRFQAVRGKDPEGRILYPELVAYTDVESFLLPDEL